MVIFLALTWRLKEVHIILVTGYKISSTWSIQINWQDMTSLEYFWRMEGIVACYSVFPYIYIVHS